MRFVVLALTEVALPLTDAVVVRSDRPLGLAERRALLAALERVPDATPDGGSAQ